MSSYPDCNPRSTIPFPIKPDVTVYPSDTVKEKTNSSIAEIFTEFKWHAKDDPFSEVCNVGSSKSFLHNAQTGKDTLGQITSYAAAQLGAQFQTHAYSVFILQDMVRILR